jgi:hypothetical protein
MSIFSSFGAGIGSIWSSITSWTAAAFAAMKGTVSAFVAKATGVPIVGPVVKAASAAVTKVATVTVGAAQGLVKVLNANPVLTTVALSIPHTWRFAGWAVDKAASVLGAAAGIVTTGATWARGVVTSGLGRIPGVGGSVALGWSRATDFVGSGIGRVAGFVSSTVRNIAGSWRHRTTSRAAAITFLGVTGLQFGLGLLGATLGFFGTPAFAFLIAAGVALTAYPAAVWFDHVVAAREAEYIAAGEEMTKEQAHEAAVDSVVTDIATGTVPTPAEPVVDEEQDDEVKQDDESTEDEAPALTEAELEDLRDADLLDKLAEYALPLAAKDKARRLLFIEGMPAIDPNKITWNRRVAYVDGIAVGVDMAPRDGQRRLSDEEHGKRVRRLRQEVERTHAPLLEQQAA